MNNYTLALANKKIYPYRVGVDKLQVKLSIFKGKTLSYLNNIPLEFWTNNEGSWKKQKNYTTNKYGISNILYDTSDMNIIDCCLAYIKATINGEVYYSNIVRFNFIEPYSFDDGIYKINAGSCSTVITDRSAYDVFDGNERNNEYVRTENV